MCTRSADRPASRQMVCRLAAIVLSLVAAQAVAHAQGYPTRACSAPIESGGFSWGRGWERLSALIRFWEAGRCRRPILGRCGSE